MLYSINAFNIKVLDARAVTRLGVRNVSFIKSINLFSDHTGMDFDHDFLRKKYSPDATHIWSSLLHNFHSLERVEIGDFKGRRLVEAM